MEKLRKIRLLSLLLCAMAAVSSHAQEADESATPATPELIQLEASWWSYFEGPRDEVESRIDGFLGDISAQVGGLQTANEADGQSILDAVRENFNAYQALLDEDEPELLELPPEDISYSVDDLLSLAALSRNALDEATQEQLEVERERRILDGASRRRDLAFKSYVDAEIGDERLLTALRLIQARLAQAIAERRLQLLTQRQVRTTAYAEGLAARVVLASDRLATTIDEAGLDKLIERVAETEALVTEAQENLRSAELAAIGLDLDTPQGRSQQRLQQQQYLDAEVGLALAEVALADAQARHSWAELKLGTAPDAQALQERALTWSELLRRVESSATDWQRETQDELLAVQSVDRDGLDRASRRLLDQRLGTAQGALTRTGELGTAVADLEILAAAVDDAVAEYSGAFRSWLSSASRLVKTGYLRVIGLADVTLFSVGETPQEQRPVVHAHQASVPRPSALRPRPVAVRAP